MRTKFILFYLIFLCFTFFSIEAYATTHPNATPTTALELPSETLLNPDKDGFESEIGRKLSFKEKIALNVVKRKLKKAAKPGGAISPEQAKTDGMAIAGFVTGLVGLFLFGIILGVLGIVFSSIALKRIKREPETRTGRGLAIAGLILGIVSVAGAIVYLAFIA